MPFAQLLGLVITKQEKDLVTAKMLVRPELCTAGGVIHGGALILKTAVEQRASQFRSGCSTY